MNKSFYPKLALQNIMKNGKFYFPYLLTVICTAAAFYICAALSDTPLETTLLRYAYLTEFMMIGLIVLGLFSLIFLIYTNSFLMKRRVRELGLYNVLGMGKRNIGLVLVFESLYIWILGAGGGILLGMLLQKLVTMAAEKLMRIGTVYTFFIAPKAILTTALFFGGCLLLTLLGNLWRLRLQKPVELLRGGQVGERQPKTRWLLALLGVASLGGGYGLALTTRTSVDALLVYFLAVGLVMVGTYCLFAAVSVVVLKLLRAKKSYYYKTKNFIGVSGMLHRMNRNAVGLGNICILSTMVMVMISGTLALYMGTPEELAGRYPAQLNLHVNYYLPEYDFDAQEAIRQAMAVVEEEGYSVTRSWSYESAPLNLLLDGNTLILRVLDENGAMLGKGDAINGILMTAEAYRSVTGETLSLSPGEVATTLPVSGTLTFRSPLDGGGRELRVAGPRLDFFLRDYGNQYLQSYYFVLPDKEAVLDLVEAVGGRYQASWYLHFDTDADEAGQLRIAAAESTRLEGLEYNFYYAIARAGADLNAEYSLNGGFFFLGIFLGIIFIVAMALIMYYKQISEGYEDRERFLIMRQVGLSRREIKSSVNAQVLIVFFAPLAVAGVHLAFNFRLVRMLLTLFSIYDGGVLVWCSLITFGVFTAVYAAMYLATARTYYNIVSE